MQELVDKIQQTYVSFNSNLNQNASGNKAAGVRARKLSLELEKLLKEYRKVSVNC